MTRSESTGLVEVALPLKVQHTFTYEVPPGMRGPAVAGVRALVPLGDRRITGYIVGSATSAPDASLKAVHDLLGPEPLLDSHMLELTRWAADYYLTSWGLVIRTSLPPGIDRSTARIVELIGSPELLIQEDDRLDPTPKQNLAGPPTRAPGPPPAAAPNPPLIPQAPLAEPGGRSTCPAPRQPGVGQVGVR